MTKRRAVISFTGGKDCHLALERTRERDDMEVVGLACFRPPGDRLRAHPIDIQELQALAMGFPLWIETVDASEQNGSYLKAYGAALKRLHEAHRVDLIVTGDMDLVDVYQCRQTNNFIDDVCRQTDCGLECWLPLWEIDRRTALEEMLARGLDIRFSCVKTPYFDESWIGRRLDLETIDELQGKSGLDVGGENGEYHTIVVDGPLYRQRLVAVEPIQVLELKNQRGQPPGEQWWVHDTSHVPYKSEAKIGSAATPTE